MRKSEKVLGLDMGTNSIGWAMVDKGEERVLGLGTVLFHDSRTKTASDPVGESNAVARREARMVRRQRDRKNYSYKQTANFLCKVLNIDSLNFGIDPYYARKCAAQGTKDPNVLARALLHLRKRRGFASNRKSGKGEEGKSLKEPTQKLQILLKEKGITLGQFLHSRDMGTVRFRYNDESIPEYFPLRSMYEDEFKAIRENNEAFMSPEDWETLHKKIFYQRPLKPQIVGTCRFYTSHNRASKHLPTTHDFRICQKLQNLKLIGKPDDFLKPYLSFIWDKLRCKKTYSFDAMRKDLRNRGAEVTESARFNLEREKEIEGNVPIVELKNIAKELKMSLPDLNPQDWDTIFEKGLKTDDDDKFLKKISQYSLPKEFALKVKEWTDKQSSSYGAVSLKFIYDILQFMLDSNGEPHGDMYHEAITKLRSEDGTPLHHSNLDNSGEICETLPYYGEIITLSLQKKSNSNDKMLLEKLKESNPQAFKELEIGKIANPTVHVALNQLVKLVNEIIRVYGRPDKINIELSRDLKNSKKNRQSIEKEIRKNTDEREELKKEFQEGRETDRFSRDDHLKMRLWKELQSGCCHNCLYCGKNISKVQLLEETEIEHILPRSWSHDNTFANKTIVHRWCNQSKEDRTPYEEFGWEPFERAQAAGLRASKLWRFASDARNRFNKRRSQYFNQLDPEEQSQFGEDLDSAWAARQMTDTQYIARISRIILGRVTGTIYKIIPLVGKLTADLRYQWNVWGRVGMGRKKTRSDNRHHAIDAFVIAMADLSMLQEAERQSARNSEVKYAPLPNWAINGVREKIHSMLIHEKPDHGTSGQMFRESAYSQELTKEEREQGFQAIKRMTIEDYVGKQLGKLKKRGGSIKSRDP